MLKDCVVRCTTDVKGMRDLNYDIFMTCCLNVLKM